MYYDSELYHHGIKGQKWGVRRFQNADGSLTKAGQKRYEALEEAANKASKFAQYAREDRKRYSDQLSGKTKRGNASKSDLNRWIEVTKAQEKKYTDLANKYKSIKISEVSKMDLKNAKKMAKDFFTEAEYSDYFQGGRWKNYQLPQSFVDPSPKKPPRIAKVDGPSNTLEMQKKVPGAVILRDGYDDYKNLKKPKNVLY